MKRNRESLLLLLKFFKSAISAYCTACFALLGSRTKTRNKEGLREEGSGDGVTECHRKSIEREHVRCCLQKDGLCCSRFTPEIWTGRYDRVVVEGRWPSHDKPKPLPALLPTHHGTPGSTRLPYRAPPPTFPGPRGARCADVAPATHKSCFSFFYIIVYVYKRHTC